MRIVALEAIANGRAVDLAFDFCGVLVGVAGNTERLGSGCDQLDASNVFIDPDLVTAGTARRNGRMHHRAFGFVFVTLKTFRAIDILL